jgi:hypothetical protein
MQVETYDLSRLYLQRWRIYHLFKKFKNDPQVPTYTFTAFVDYALGYHSQVIAQSRRSSETWEPQYIPRSEPAHIIATHSAWFIAQPLQESDPSQGDFIDPQTLETGVRLKKVRQMLPNQPSSC